MNEAYYRGEIFNTNTLPFPKIRKGVQTINGVCSDGRPKPPIVQSRFGEIVFLSYKDINLVPPKASYELGLTLAHGVDNFLAENTNYPSYTVVDVGTGSGVIAVSFGHNIREDIQIIATDISSSALEVANLNAQLNQVAGIEFRKRDMLEGDHAEFGKLDGIICNPPFSPSNAIPGHIRATHFVPEISVDGGPDGLEFYRRLFAESKTILSDVGWVATLCESFRSQTIVALALSELNGISHKPLPLSGKNLTGHLFGPEEVLRYFPG